MKDIMKLTRITGVLFTLVVCISGLSLAEPKGDGGGYQQSENKVFEDGDGNQNTEENKLTVYYDNETGRHEAVYYDATSYDVRSQSDPTVEASNLALGGSGNNMNDYHQNSNSQMMDKNGNMLIGE